MPVQPVRCKFKCISAGKTIGWSSLGAPFLYAYEFQPVANSSPENRRFWEATPSGSLKLSSVKSSLFEVGQEYYLDFTTAGAEEDS